MNIKSLVPTIATFAIWAAMFYTSLNYPTYLTYSLLILSVAAYMVGRQHRGTKLQEPSTPERPKLKPLAPQRPLPVVNRTQPGLNNELEVLAKKEVKPEPMEFEIKKEDEPVQVLLKEEVKSQKSKEELEMDAEVDKILQESKEAKG